MCLGIPGQIVEITDAARSRAQVDIEGVRHEVSLAMLESDVTDRVHLGDWVIVHLGFAMDKIEQFDALGMLDERKALHAMYAQELT